MEEASECCDSIQDGSCEYLQGVDSVLTYTPCGFQDPFQLLHLKMIWFHHLYSTYCIRVRQLSKENTLDQLNVHCAVIGVSHSSTSQYLPVVEVAPQLKWLSGLLSCVLDIPTDILLSSPPQQCYSERIHFLDKLDLIEHINYPMAQRRHDLQRMAKENLDITEQNTRTFELGFDSFVQNVQSASSLFEAALLSLINNSPAVSVSTCTAVQALRQHIFWINSSLLSALVNSCGVTTEPLSNGGGNTQLVKLQDDQDVTLLCSHIVNPMSVLHWFEHQIAQEILSVQNMEHSCRPPTVTATCSTHQWTLDCCKECHLQYLILS